jgi:hypothetical protein
MNRIGIIVAGALVALMLLSSTLFVVDQRQVAVVYALGEIKDVITEPGLKFKLPPPFQNVVFLDKRIQTLDSPSPPRRRAWSSTGSSSGALPSRVSSSATTAPTCAIWKLASARWCRRLSTKRSPSAR